MLLHHMQPSITLVNEADIQSCFFHGANDKNNLSLTLKMHIFVLTDYTFSAAFVVPRAARRLAATSSLDGTFEFVEFELPMIPAGTHVFWGELPPIVCPAPGK